MIIKITKQDLQRGRVLTPNWYMVDIVGVDVRHAKSDPNSYNYVFTFRFPSVDNYELDHTFNSKAIGFMTPFIAALRDTNINTIAQQMDGNDFDFDTESALGHQIQVKVVNETYEGRLTNKVKEFLPKGATVPF